MKKLAAIVFTCLLFLGFAFTNKTYAANSCSIYQKACNSEGKCVPLDAEKNSNDCGILQCINNVCTVPGSSSTTQLTLKVLVGNDEPSTIKKTDSPYLRLAGVQPNTKYVFQIFDTSGSEERANYTVTADASSQCPSGGVAGKKNSSVWGHASCFGGFIDVSLTLANFPNDWFNADSTKRSVFPVAVKDTSATGSIVIAGTPKSSPSPSPVSCQYNVDNSDKGEYQSSCDTVREADPCGKETNYCDGSSHKKPQPLICFDQTPDDNDSRGTCVFKDTAQLPVLSAPSVTFPNQPFTVSVSSCKSATAKFSCSDIAANSGDIGTTTSTSSCGEPPEANTANENASTKINFTKKGYALIKVDCGGIQTSTTVTLSEALFTPTPTPPLPPCKVDIYSTDGKGCTSIYSAIGDLSTDSFGFIGQLFAVLLSISGGIALLLIIRSGYQLMTSQGNPEKVKEARERLTSVFVGLLFLVLSIVILEVIGVDLLNLPGLSK